MDLLVNSVFVIRIRLLLIVFMILGSDLSLADLHGTLTGTTNYADRWFSKSDNNVALQANLDYEHRSGFYVGTNISNIDFETNESVADDEASHVEIIPYVGWSKRLSEQWRLDLQWSRYLYDGKVFGHEADYNEFYVFLHFKDLISTRISVADDYYGLHNYALDYALTGRYPITDALQFSATFGYAQTQAALGSDYPYWHMGFSYAYTIVTFTARYMDSAETFIDEAVAEPLHAFYDPPVLDATGVFSISIGF